MASSTKTTTVRFDEKDKAEAVALLDSMGITLNGYLNMAVKQLINKRRVPFELDAPSEVPSEETSKAIATALAKEYGLIEDDSPSFDDAASAVAFLGNL